MTPLIDVVFILLVFFMLTTRLLPVNLMEVSSDVQSESGAQQGEPVPEVRILPGQNLEWNRQSYALEELVRELSGAGIDRVNVTSSPDATIHDFSLVFLLLMFFIVAGQMQDRALPELPGTAAEQTSDRAEADMVVLASGDWQVNGESVDAVNLSRHLPAPDRQASLTIGAASGSSMADLESLFSLLSETGYQDIVLLTEPSGP